MAYPPGNKFAWNGIPVRLNLPASGETVNSEWFSVPGGTKVLQITVGAMVGAAATVKIQALACTETVEATQVWTDVSVFDLTDGTMEVLDGLVESTCVTIPVSATGGGNLRFVASEDQSSVPSIIKVFCSRDG